MTKKEVLDLFVTYNKPFSDYWSMQLAWTCLVDSLVKDGQVNSKRSSNWVNPCSVEGFKTFNKNFKGLSD